jgi:hypothetical protein
MGRPARVACAATSRASAQQQQQAVAVAVNCAHGRLALLLQCCQHRPLSSGNRRSCGHCCCAVCWPATFPMCTQTRLLPPRLHCQESLRAAGTCPAPQHRPQSHAVAQGRPKLPAACQGHPCCWCCCRHCCRHQCWSVLHSAQLPCLSLRQPHTQPPARPPRTQPPACCSVADGSHHRCCRTTLRPLRPLSQAEGL